MKLRMWYELELEVDVDYEPGSFPTRLDPGSDPQVTINSIRPVLHDLDTGREKSLGAEIPQAVFDEFNIQGDCELEAAERASEDNGPDPDYEYERWRDRQLEAAFDEDKD